MLTNAEFIYVKQIDVFVFPTLLTNEMWYKEDNSKRITLVKNKLA